MGSISTSSGMPSGKRSPVSVMKTRSPDSPAHSTDARTKSERYRRTASTVPP